MNSMQPSIGKIYIFLLIAKDVWDAVKEVYSDPKNPSQIFEIKTRLWQIKPRERGYRVLLGDDVSMARTQS